MPSSSQGFTSGMYGPHLKEKFILLYFIFLKTNYVKHNIYVRMLSNGKIGQFSENCFPLRLERDLYSRKDQLGVEIRERAKWDIREAMVGADFFKPKHIVIATWKNVSFAGGIVSARRIVSSYNAYVRT